MAFRILTLNTITFGINACDIVTFSKMTFSITATSITAFDTMTLITSGQYYKHMAIINDDSSVVSN